MKDKNVSGTEGVLFFMDDTLPPMRATKEQDGTWNGWGGDAKFANLDFVAGFLPTFVPVDPGKAVGCTEYFRSVNYAPSVGDVLRVQWVKEGPYAKVEYKTCLNFTQPHPHWHVQEEDDEEPATCSTDSLASDFLSSAFSIFPVRLRFTEDKDEE